MRRIPIDVFGLAAASGISGCTTEFEPAQPWYIPASNDEDDAADDGPAGETASEAGESDGAANDDGTPPPSDADADDGTPPPADDGGDPSDSAGESSDSGNATAPMESPYEGGWDIGDCQDSIGAANNQVGGILEDFTFTDQFGEQVRLYDFCHKAILIAEGAFW